MSNFVERMHRKLLQPAVLKEELDSIHGDYLVTTDADQLIADLERLIRDLKVVGGTDE